MSLTKADGDMKTLIAEFKKAQKRRRHKPKPKAKPKPAKRGKKKS